MSGGASPCQNAAHHAPWEREVAASLVAPYTPGWTDNMTMNYDDADRETDASAGPGNPASAAQEQALNLKDQAIDSGKGVAATARNEVSNVLGETKSQAKELLLQARSELGDQAAKQQTRAADGLRTVGDDLEEMAAASSSGGLASELVGQAASRAEAVATWLDAREPGDLLGEVRAFAGRQPLMFVAIAAGAGVFAGRLARSLTSSTTAEDPETSASATPIYSSVASSHAPGPGLESSAPTTSAAPPVAGGWSAEGPQ